MIRVFDSSASIALLRREPGWDIVMDLLIDPDSIGYSHAINLCEVYYDFHRAAGERTAEDAIRDLLATGILPRDDMDAAFWKEMGRVKSVHRRVSLADCGCITLARRVGGEVITADHHEFDAIDQVGLCPVTFIR